MCDKATVQNGGALRFFSEKCNNKKMWNQHVCNYVDASEYVPKCFDML